MGRVISIVLLVLMLLTLSSCKVTIDIDSNVNVIPLYDLDTEANDKVVGRIDANDGYIEYQ